MPVTLPNTAIYYGLLAFCLLLGGGLLAMAATRPRRERRWPRMAAGALAAGALWFTAFPPLRQRPAASAEAILLTDGYSPDTLRQLQRRLAAGTPVWYLGSGQAPAPARPLGSLLTLAEQRPALRRLHILGPGLPAADLPMLGNITLQGHSGAGFTGFEAAFWQHELALGEVLRVEGTVAGLPGNGLGNGPGWVGLRAEGAVRDSVRIPPNGRPFRLHYQPKATGRALYELLLRRPGQPLVAEPVPVEITAPVRPAVLLLAAAPSFEFKFLKNYLAEAHYPVALRTTVSRGLVQTDFVNQPAQPLTRLTPALLARYAVLVADAPTLASLAGAETQALQAALRTGRLGLLLLADAAPLPRSTPARADFAMLLRPGGPTAAPQALTWPNAPTAAKAVLSAQLRATPQLRPLVTGPQQALVAAARRVGLGFVVVSVVPETFRWALQGNPTLYASFWHRLLAAALPPAPAAATWHVGNRWPRPYQPLTLHLATALPSPLPASQPTAGPLTNGPPARLALRQDPRLPEWSTAQFWPGAAGWHQVHGPGRTVHSFYVYPAATWPGPERRERQQATAQRTQPAPTSTRPAETATLLAEPWPAAWFFGLFLLAAGYLWLEEKL